ncbi:YbaN family protein [Ornithinibacillus halotolerans]|uniref:Membrane protein n=1 Tax=Ornithinibacillus halotolerans TaxID=1274357 RepID=A0A916S4X3_9BACI|nr:YbaN family protein [Ornithinibacillus halotolerans]GGA84675.1 membrane protein [Ornithinibacillus halotolerans]
MYIKKLFLVTAGLVSLLLAVIGIFLPLIPTTPLLLLAAACFIRSSERLYEWLITNKYLGPYIKNYREGNGIPLQAKIIGVTLLWISMLFTIFFVVPLLVVKVLLAGIAAYFTWFILKQKTLIRAH